MTFSRPAVVLAALLALVQACSRTDIFASTSLTIEPAEVTVALGQTRQFTATPASPAVVWSVSPPEAGTVDADGLFTATARLDAAGPATVRVTRADDASDFAEARVTLVRPDASAPTTVLKAGGDNQLATVGEPLPAPLRVRVFDEEMRGVPGVVVRFPDSEETTDALGYAAASPVAGERVGPQRFEVSVDGVGTLAFSANLSAGPVAAIEATHPEPTGIVSSTLAVPAQVRFTDRFGNVVPGQSAEATTTGGGEVEALQPVSDAFGFQRFSLTLGAELGTQSFVFRSGEHESALEIEAVAGAPALLQLVSGDAQAGSVGAPLAQPLVVRLLDATGLPAAGGAVAWSAPDGGQLVDVETTADADGYASATFVLPTRAGVVRVVADANGVSGSPATFTLRANAGVAQRLQPVSGGNQTTTTGALFGGAFSVRVTDGYSNGVAGIPVAFEAIAGGGSVSDPVVISGADGLAQTQMIAGAVGAQRYRASVTGLVGSPLEITNQAVAVNAALKLELVSGQDQQSFAGFDLPQPFIVRVLRDGQPAAQHAVTFAVSSGGGSVRPTLVTTATNGTAAATARLGPGEGVQRFAASVPGAENSPLFFEATSRPRPVAELRIVSGDGQTALPGDPLALPFVVQAVDAEGQPLPNREVTFDSPDEGIVFSNDALLTDAQGLASTLATTSQTEGSHTAVASCEGVSVTFHFEVSSRQALRLLVVSGDNLSAEVGLTLPEPFVVQAVNAVGAPVAGVEVRWRGESPLSSVSHAFTVTDPQGMARVTGTLGRLVGLQRFFAEADEAQPTQFRATALAAPAERLSIVSGDGQHALASSALTQPLVVAALDRVGNPVMNVPVSFRAGMGGGQVSLASATTVANGEASTSATLGALIGPQTFVAESPGLTPATFTARATSPISHLSVSPQGQQVEVGASLRFQATAVYTDGTSGDVTREATWSVLDASALSIDDAPGTKGLARALAAGTTSVRATLAGASGTTPVTVVPATLRALTLLPALPRMVVGATRAFTATGTFSNDAVASVTETSSWTSSDPSVVTVSDLAGTRGLVTATGVGTAVVTATSQGVSASRTVVVSDAALTHLEISPAHVSLPAGSAQPFTATATYADGTVEDVTASAQWSSSDETRMTVQNAPAQAGYATLLAPGKASVRVTWAGRTVEQSVQVTDATVVSLAVQPGRIELAVRDFFQFQVAATYSDGTVKDARSLVTWTTSNAAVADVSNAAGSEGVVTGLAPGQAVITAKLGTRIASGTAVVNGDAYQQLRIFSDQEATCPVGGAVFLQAGAIYDSFPPRSVDISDQASWSSSDPDVAVVGNGALYGGSVRCLSPGRVTITAAWRGVSDTRVITVASTALSSITITPGQATLARGDVQRFFAIARYVDGSELDVTGLATWASTAPDVVSLSNAQGTRGVATGQGAGTAQLTATLDGVVGTAAVTGSGATLTQVVITPEAPSPRVRERFQQFTATAIYDDGTKRDVTAQARWDVTNPSVAYVSTDPRFPGLVVLQAQGTCGVVATYAGLNGLATLTVRP